MKQAREGTFPTLLMVDADPTRGQQFAALASDGVLPWHISFANGVKDARNALSATRFDAVWVSHALPDGTLFDLQAMLSKQACVMAFLPGAEHALAKALELQIGECLLLDAASHYLAFLPGTLHAARQRFVDGALLHRKLAMLERVSEMASVGGWRFDPGTREVLWSDETRRIHDVDNDFVPTAKNVSAFYAPETREEVFRQIARYNSDGEPYVMEIEIVSGLGQRVWTRVHGDTQFENGVAVSVWGTMQDVTTQKRTELELVEATRQLAQTSQDLRLTLDSISQGILRADANGRVMVSNQQFIALLELPPSLIVPGATLDAINAFQAQRGDVMRAITAIGHSGEDDQPLHEPEACICTLPDGSSLEIRTRRLPDGGLVRTVTDMSAYFNAQSALQQSETRFRSLTGLSSDWYWELDAQFHFLPIEASAVKSGAGVLTIPSGSALWELPASNMNEADWDALRKQLDAHEIFRDLELESFDGAGTAMWVSISGTPIVESSGKFVGYRGVGRNITEQKNVQRRIEQQAFYDALTLLPNRRMLLDRLAQAIAGGTRSSQCGAVMFIDLDNFKTLNDTLGHTMGDELLRQVAARLLESVRQIDTVARFGGDEFVVMLVELGVDETQAAAQALVIGQKIISSLNLPFSLAGRAHHTSPSIGITIFNGHSADVDELIKRADEAMYQSKAGGRNTLRFYEAPMLVVNAPSSQCRKR